MSVQPYQLIFIFIFAVLIYSFWKIDNKKVRICIAILAGIIFLFNPLRFKQEGGANLEKSVNRFDKLPDKVVVKEKGFNEKQQEEMDKLKHQTEELKDEIHD